MGKEGRGREGEREQTREAREGAERQRDGGEGDKEGKGRATESGSKHERKEKKR